MEQPYVYAYPAGAGAGAAPPQQPVAPGIVSPAYCAPYPVDLAIVRKVMTLTDGNFVVTDVKGNILFKVKEPMFGLHDKRILLDASGSPVVTLREKIMSMHDRWQVFRGGSTEARDLLYTVKRSSMLQFKTKLDVFLSHNKDEKRCDFRVKGSWFERSCVVYAGDSDSIVAQMHKKHTAQSILLGKDNFTVTVYPNVDYAFIVSLIVMLDDMNREDAASSGSF
ncbi:PREDICTED: protein LURP-one-related 15 [Tarenaya hassleriana]|uniref:protein LURP-one-related 15 n=1 Tax=Tarenaya hassleriana TaxID=28532 RepID=UPI00053C42D9|nr:PREDICTED: protein LURP-one-related 15 [Tarenaya hassleriana]